MVFGPWIEVFTWVQGLLPDFSRFKFKFPKIHLTFIALHYTYLLSLTIIASIILYGAGNLAYIDALFFGSGAATQSGLNTVNVNELFLYQQITLTLISGIANPIFINTFVVFVRLYWFEKRFQHVVLEAQKYRRTRDRSRTRSMARDEDIGAGIEKEERGVGNRKIVVMHAGVETIAIAKHEQEALDEDSNSGDSGPSSSSDHDRQQGGAAESDDENNRESRGQDSSPNQPHKRDIVFADELKEPGQIHRDPDEFPSQLPANQHTTDDHIAFLENQRNPKDKGTLYIPSPRDFDQGQGPQEISDEEKASLSRTGTNIPDTPVRDTTDNSGSKARRDKKLISEEAASVFKIAKNGIESRLQPQTQNTDEGEKLKTPHPTVGTEDGNNTLRQRGRARTFATFMTSRNDNDDPMPYLSYQATIGRNSQFVNLTEEQREELGGIEYRALKTLAVVLCVYYIGFHLLGILCLVPWIVRSERYSALVRSDGVSPTWWGFFTSASMFNDLGYTLTPDSMISFQFAIFPLLIGSYLIIIGNTGFPCMLRFVIWVLSKLVPKGSSIWEEYRFLLDHPRRCFTLLFPSKATWWLFWVLVLLNGLDLLFFIILDLGDSTVTELPVGIRVLAGWFQAVSTRTAGFGVVNLADLHPGVQVSYLIMMYISIFPIAISVRQTNVYEEKSLGVWHPQADDDEDQGGGIVHSYIGNHLRRQLSFDLWFVFLGLFVIAIVEGGQIQNQNDYAFTLFSILFEVVSAYGTVGLSLGYPGIDASFSTEFHVLSKLVIIAMQIRGRHRGLPYALDKAILLPSEDQQRKENEEGLRRLQRSGTAASTRSARSTDPQLSAATTVRRNDRGHNEEEDEEEGDRIQVSTIRRTSGLSMNSTERDRRKNRGGFAKLLESAFTAGPSAKMD